MLKRIVLIFFTCVLSMAFSFCSFADFTSDLQRYVPTSSNASMIPYSSLGTVSNTVEWSAGGYISFLVDGSWYTIDSIASAFPDSNVQTKLTRSDSSGLSFYVTSDDLDISRVSFVVNGSALPVARSYTLSFDLASDFTASYSDITLAGARAYVSAADSATQSNITSSVRYNDAGEAYCSGLNITISSVSSFNVSFYLSEPMHNFGGSFRMRLVPYSGDTSVDVGSSSSSGEWESDVSSSLGNISSSLGDISSSLSSAEESLEYISQSQNLIIQGIDNVILHISDQLYAFWDQLYNLIHVPTMAKLDDIIAAINNLKLDVTVDLDELLDTLNQNHEDQIANDNSIADQIQNGYDDSSLSSDNDRLNTVIDQYDDMEDQLFSDSKDYISNFEFTDSLAPFLGPLTAISGFLSGIYVALGSLNIPIAFSLSLSIALLMIGWYRFRGGG